MREPVEATEQESAAEAAVAAGRAAPVADGAAVHVALAVEAVADAVARKGQAEVVAAGMGGVDGAVAAAAEEGG